MSAHEKVETAVSTYAAPLPTEERPPPTRGERKLLTALCYDLVGSTELLQKMDIEDYQDLLGTFQVNARKAVEANFGALRADTGDGGLALFPMELDPRDATAYAIAAGFDIISACRRVADDLHQQDLAVRVGVATSYFLVSGTGPDATAGRVTGAALALATRLQSLATPGSVLVSDDTRQLAGRSYGFVSAGTHLLKGFAATQQVWRAMRRRRNADRFFAFGRVTTPFVGRDDELRQINQIWQRAAAGAGQVIEITGEAGLGKSRMLHALRKLTRRRRAQYLLFQCLPGGAQSALHPLLYAFQKNAPADGAQVLASQVQQQFKEAGITDAQVIDTFSFLLGVKGAGSALAEADLATVREQASLAVASGLHQLAARGPVVLVLEDVNWSDLTTRQLLVEAARAIAGLPVLLVITSRLPHTVQWPAGASVFSLPLRPLDMDSSNAAIRTALAGGAPVSAATFKVVSQLAAGVPLLIEEICRWNAENGQALDALTAQKGQSRSLTFERILSSRMAQIGDHVQVLHAASVAVHRFGADMLHALLPEWNRADVASALEQLVKSGFVNRIRLTEPPLYMFRHSLIQETIYQGLMRAEKQSLHARLFAALRQQPGLAPWLGNVACAEHAERGGLLEDAIVCYTQAGRELEDRSAYAEARLVLERALLLCEQVHRPDRQDTLRLSAMAELGPVLTASEGPSSLPARKLYEEAVGLARRRPFDEKARWYPLYWGWWFTGTDVNGERAHAVLRELKGVDDAQVQLQARHCVWAIDFYLGKHNNCITCVEEALPLYEPIEAHSHQFGGHDAKVCGLAHRGLSLWFRGRVSDALSDVKAAKALAGERKHVGSIAHALGNHAILSCYRRDFEALRADIAELRQLTEKNRLSALAATALIYEGWCEGALGSAEQGFSAIENGLRLHRDLQTPEDYPVYCCMLAEVAERCGREADVAALLDQAISSAEDAGHLYWLAEVHRWQARGAVRLGKGDAAGKYAKALAIAQGQGAIPLLLTAYDDLTSSGLGSDLIRQYERVVQQSRAALADDVPLYVNPPPPLRLP